MLAFSTPEDLRLELTLILNWIRDQSKETERERPRQEDDVFTL